MKGFEDVFTFVFDTTKNIFYCCNIFDTEEVTVDLDVLDFGFNDVCEDFHLTAREFSATTDIVFKSFSTPVINTLAQLGVKAEFTGRNDLEIDGKKFCGNAQAYINGRIMHHGCLLFDVDLSVLANALKVSKDKFESKGVKSVRARVTNIIDELPEKITVEEFRDLLLDYMKKEYPEMTEYVFSDEELAEINRIKETKFGTWDWNYGKSPEYNVRRGTKFPSGKVEIFANVIESKIQDIKIYGDFFGIEDVAAVEDVLRGVKYEREDVLKALQTINLGRYFAGITAEEIAEAVVE